MSLVENARQTGTPELLSTKLSPPQLHASLVPRERLLTRLDEALTRKLTLISAPAGFGKTTLVSQWLAHLQFSMYDLPAGADKIIHPKFPESPFGRRAGKIPNPPVAWVALDEGDNDPVRFWRYVITACQRFDRQLGVSALKLLQETQQPPLEVMLTGWINELARLSGRYILALEDYHLITSPQLHRLLAFLLDHLPDTLHLFILTRSDPPLPLARLRARYEILELRATDLRFSSAEIQTFLQQTLPLSLSPDTLAHLEARTEGWAAGLRLVALAVQGRKDSQEIEHFLTTFSGSHGHVLEYLVEEVLSVQPELRREFLLHTAFLSRLTASLGDAVMGGTDSALILEELERANLFLIPLDEAGQWYRYHALFAEAMQHYARQYLGEARLRRLSNQASLWYEQHNLLAEAVEAALTAHEFRRAAHLIERVIAPRLAHNEYHTLRRWIAHLPETVLYQHPHLCLTYAIAVLFTSDRSAPATVALLNGPLDVAEQTWRAEANRLKLGEVLAFRALVFWLQGEFGPAFSVARQALELLPEAEVQWRGISLIFAGVEELMAGHLNIARQTLLQARALCQTTTNIYGTVDSTLILGQICIEQRELRQAFQIYRQVLTELEQAPMDRDQALVRRGRALLGLSTLNLEWNALEQAQQQASEALELGRQYGDDDLLTRSSLILARIHQAQGETAQAQQMLHHLAARITRPLLLREIRAGQARLALITGDLITAERWATTVPESDGPVPRPQQEQEMLLTIRLQMAQGQAGAALAWLEAQQPQAHSQGRVGAELEMINLKALAYFQLNNLLQAKQTLIEALTRAQPEGYHRLFLNEGEVMARLLQAVLPELQEEALAIYGQGLLNAFISDRQPGPLPPTSKVEDILHSSPPNLIEPLSSQEERVLRLLVAGLSNPEIARELIVSINTVKTQVKSIYRKLNVHNRAEARAAVRRLNLG